MIQHTIRQTNKLEEAVFCKSMCESIICYGFREGKTAAEYVDENAEYLGRYIEMFNKGPVVAIMQDVLDNLIRVDENTFTDSEGVSYNSPVYKEGYSSSEVLMNALYELWDRTVGYKKN